MDLMHFRMQLADAKAYLRTCKDQYETTRAICEMRVQTTGKNEADRKRELTVALSQDTQHTIALTQLREAEARIENLQAAIEVEEDARREREWAIRERLAAALGGQTEDAVFDHTQDRALYQGSTAAYASRARGPDGNAATLDDLYPPNYKPF